MILEEIDDEYYFEAILSPYDFKQIDEEGGVGQEYSWYNEEKKGINVYIRKENSRDRRKTVD